MPSLPVPVRLKSEQSRDAAAADVAALQAVAVSFEDAARPLLIRRAYVASSHVGARLHRKVLHDRLLQRGDDLRHIDGGEKDGNGALAWDRPPTGREFGP